MTPEEYRALAERLLRVVVWDEDDAKAICEASAALPALLDANEALRAEARQLAIQTTLLPPTVWDKSTHTWHMTGEAYDACVNAAADAIAEVAALRAQLADATTITDEMVERAAEALYADNRYWNDPHGLAWADHVRSASRPFVGEWRRRARLVLTAALSVPAVPVDEEAL